MLLPGAGAVWNAPRFYRKGLLRCPSTVQLRLSAACTGAPALDRWASIPPGPERAAQTAKARAARWAKYEARVDPDGKLDEATRRKLAKQAYDADMLRMSRLAAKKRRQGDAA